MLRTWFRNAILVDGVGVARRGVTVVVEGDRIVAVDVDEEVGRPSPGDSVYDLDGQKSVMPGMVTCHFHSAYDHVTSTNDIDMRHPATYLALVAAKNAEIALRSGFTGAVGAAAIHNIDVTLKEAIADGLVVGPRMLASSRDLCTTGGPVDMRPTHWGPFHEGVTRLCDGPDEFRKAVREEAKRGADIIKLHVTGGHGSFDVWPEAMVMTTAELEAAVEAAHSLGKRIRGHVATKGGIMAALAAGLDVIDHGDGLDEECAQGLAETGTFLAPTMFLMSRVLDNLRAAGPVAARQLAAVEPAFDRACAGMALAHEAGVTIVAGDDFGAGPIAHGEYAKELGVYVHCVGLSELDAIRIATQNGAQLLGMKDEVGVIEAGRLADLLVVDGDPTTDIAVLQDRDKLDVVMKGGVMVDCKLAPAAPVAAR